MFLIMSNAISLFSANIPKEYAAFQTVCFTQINWEKHVGYVPHFAKATINNEQWLTNGYYFWLNSIQFAKDWGVNRFSKNGRNYSITAYHLSFSNNQVFDLISNTDHELLLEKYFKIYDKHYKKSLSEGKIIKKPSIATVLEFFRKLSKDSFPFKAITITDKWTDHKKEIAREKVKMVSADKDKHTYQPVGRPQICVIEDISSCIKAKEPCFPEEYIQASKKVLGC